jgi:predicted O-linked N-acetylglucosamine transferase (SPINDLY family)
MPQPKAPMTQAPPPHAPTPAADPTGDDVHRVIVEAEAAKASGGGSAAAIAHYQRWIAEHPNDPGRHLVIYNLAAEWLRAGRPEDAARAFEHVCRIAPALVHGWLGQASAAERLGELDRAIQCWRTALRVGSADDGPVQPVITALNHLGRVLEMREDLEGAQDALLQSLRLRPDQYDVLQHVIRNRQRQCEWPVWADLPQTEVTAAQLMQASSPMAMLGLADDPAMQLMAARGFVERSYRKWIDLHQSSVQALRAAPHRRERLRIGYASGDLCMHPVGLLLGGLLEQHDRSRFEIFVYCWSPEDGSAHRQRLKQAPEHFRRVDALSDEALAELIRQDGIDLLIDLQGVSAGARPGVLARRPAPVQVSWLGLIGTSALPWLDYVIADDYCVRGEDALFYTERVVRLPGGFQPGDRGRFATPTPSRASLGLPDDRFVFASFNNSYKHSPTTLDSWSRILKRAPESVLWLLDDNPRATQNLLRELATRGVGRDRIVLAGRTWHGEYLGRMPAADLFLDAYPYNAGTTAADALWMGLPLLTRSGRTFIARMAGSLLNTAGLNELIAHSAQEYEDKAVHWAQSPEAYRTLRARVQAARDQSPLFDDRRAARDLEAAALALWDTHLQGIHSRRLSIELGSAAASHRPALGPDVASPDERTHEAQADDPAQPRIVLASDTLPPNLPVAPRRLRVPHRWTRSLLMGQGIDPARIDLVPPAARRPLLPRSDDRLERRAHVRARLGISADDRVLINLDGAGRLAGTDLLLRALADLHRLGWPRVHLLIRPGPGDQARSIEQALQDLHAAGTPVPDTVIGALIAVPALLQDDDHSRLLNLADLYVSPHRALPTDLPLLDAALEGLPVLATQGGVADELIEAGAAHGLTATLEQVRDSDGRERRYLEPDYGVLLGQLMEWLQGRPLTGLARASGQALFDARQTDAGQQMSAAAREAGLL